MIRLAVLASLLLAPVLGGAQEPPAAEVDAANLRSWLLAGRQLTLVDSRSEAEYESGHIPGAISIPEEEMKDDAWRLPSDKTVPVVFYCRGPGWPLSREAAVAAWRLGHKTVILYRGGWPDWQAKGLPVATGKVPGTLKGGAKKK